MIGLQEVDKSKMYLGDDFVINEYITVHQPTIKEIVYDYGEKEYYNMIYSLCGSPDDVKSQLWDMGIDWTTISDFEYFLMIAQGFSQEQTSIVLGDIDLSSFNIGVNPENDEPCLFRYIDKTEEHLLELKPIKKLIYKILKKPLSTFVNTKELQIIDELVYTQMITYLRVMHGIKRNQEKKKLSKAAKELLILDEKEKVQMASRKRKNQPDDSILFPMMSSLCNSAEFKYKPNELKDITIFQFMDSIQRIQVIRSSDALLKGCYGGMLDVSKLNKEELNWMRSINN